MTGNRIGAALLGMVFAGYSLILAAKAVAQPAGAAGAPSVNGGVYTAAQAQRGEEIYLDQCAHCHGQALEGSEPAPALAGSVFVANWSGLPLDELFQRIRTTMPEENPGSLSRQETVDIMARILQENGYPEGDAELASQEAALKAIKFEPPR